LGVAWLCAIHGAIVENILFEDGGDANTIRAFNTTQAFFYLKKNVIDPLQSQVNMLVIILLCNDYLLK
jgi:hypothetical protein